MPANVENLVMATGWERWVFIPIPKKDSAKECSKYRIITLTSCTSKVMLKILQPWLLQYMNRELQDIQAEFRKGRGTRDQIANIHWIIEKQKNFGKKTSTSASLTTLKPLTMWITTNWKILKEMEYQTILLVSWEICMQVKKQQLEPYTDNWLVQNWERSRSLYTVILLI